MIAFEDCSYCYGGGRVHSTGCNGDPDDDGERCPECDGAGVIEIDLNDEADDD